MPVPDLARTFDDAPDVYDRVRPVMPMALFDDLAALGTLPRGARVVEIGCGTGQATVPLAQRFVVVAVELGERLAAFTRAKLATSANVEIVTSSFEAWEPGDEQFDAVVACNAFHWIDPQVRYAKPAAVLRDGGVLAVASSTYVCPEDGDPFEEEVQADYRAVGAADPSKGPLHPDQVTDYADEIAASGRFANVAARRYSWEVVFTADEYVALLTTSSWHRTLAPRTRDELIERIHRRIRARPNGSIRATLLATLNVARRLQPRST